MTVTNFYNDNGIYNEIIINGDNATIHANEKKPQTGAVEEAEAETGEEDADNPLKRFIPNKEDFEYVVEYAKVCKTPRDIYNCIVLPMKMKGYGLDVTTNPPFLKALTPLLTNYTSSKNAESISRALRK